MSRSNPPFYTGPDLGLPDADDFLHNPSTANPASQAAGEDSELGSTDSKGTFLLDWNLHYDDHESSVQENLPDSSLFSDLMVDFGNTGGGLAAQSFAPDQILELNSPDMEIFPSNEEMLSPKRNKLLPPFSGPTQTKTLKLSNPNIKKEAKGNNILDCICNQPQENRFILICDKCDKWFHCECVGISQEQGEEMSRERHIWLCPVCNESAGATNRSQIHKEPKSHIATRSQHRLDAKIPILKIPKKSVPVKEGKRCYLKSCQKRLTNQNNHFCSNACIEVTVNNLKSFYQIKGLPSADSERVTLLDKSNMKILTGVSAPTLGGLAAWLKAHSTHVPIKPQPRPSQDLSATTSKYDIKLETPISNHEEIVRGKARKQLTDILLSRVESSSEYTKYSDSIPKVASQIEIQLFAIDRGISTRYKNRYRSLSFSLRDPKNVSLYRRVVSGEILPENLVQMSTEVLVSESSNSAKESKNNSKTDISTTRSKTHDKQSSVDYSSGEMARKNVHNQPKTQNSNKYVLDEKNKQTAYSSKHIQSQSSKSNDIPVTPLMTTEIDIPPPKFSPTLSDSDEQSEIDKIVWRGSISMPNLAKCVTNGYLAYGPYIPDMEKILPQNVQVHGRIVYTMVWDYLKKIVSSTTKGLVVLRLVPKSRDEEISFTTLFNYFHKRQRCGVAGGCTATVRDLYLLPFTKGDTIPSLLTTLQGPGVPTLKTDTLLAMIVTNKPSDSPLSTAAAKRSSSEVDTLILGELRGSDQKTNPSKQDISSLTNPSAPLPFSSIHSKTDLPFSSSSSKTEPGTGSSSDITSKLFNPSGLYKPISESDTSDAIKESYMIPYDKAEREVSFNFGLSSTAGDHIFPGLGEILKKSMDDPIIEDALSNLHFKKPIKDGQITPEGYIGYPGAERKGEGDHSDLQALRQQPQGQHPFHPPANQTQNTEQFQIPYYNQEPVQQSEHQFQQGQQQVPGQAYQSHEVQAYSHNTAEYWSQDARDAHYKQKQKEMLVGPQNQPAGQPIGYEGYPQQQWPTPSHTQTPEIPHDSAHAHEYVRYPPNQNNQYRQQEDYARMQKHDNFTPYQIPPEHTSPEHRLPLHPQLQVTQHLPEHRQHHEQSEGYRRLAHEYSQPNEHVNEYNEHRLQRDQYPTARQGDRYFERDYLDKQPLRHDEEEKKRDVYPYQHNSNEEGRDWKQPFEQLRDEDKWASNDRRILDKKFDRNLTGRDFRLEREEKEREQEMLSWDLERARRDFRLSDAEFIEQARLESRALPPYLRRRLPLRTAISHHLDLARRDLGTFRGRGSPIGIGIRPSLLDRDRVRLKRDFPPDSNALGVPLKLYRTMESPPKPSFEPISRTRSTLRIRKRDRIRKSPRPRPRDDDKSSVVKDDESIGSRKERRPRRRSRFSRSKDSGKNEESNCNKQQQTPDKSQQEISNGNTDNNITDTQPELPNDEIYPQVVQEVVNNNESTPMKDPPVPPPVDTTSPRIKSNALSQSEEDKLAKFPPKHLQREKLLAMQEKLHNTTPTKGIEKSEKSKRRSRTRSREREGKGRRRRSRSREWTRRAHSRDDLHRDKEPAAIISRERLIREREEIPRREPPPSLRERQLFALERERELLRARARLTLPPTTTIDNIRERSPLRVGDLDPRRPIVSPFIRARALDELRRERMERGVPGGVFRGQYLYQSPRQ
ncbi:hypothetical protein LOD99_5017 [Oopsacas minuta]|uniref:PHD finger protein 3 n=1 Tax=Oopsacas minuta TaxID=111878 RepID=A0AAV7JTQ0_9METZ|nr:hypothetical protein LOD99_5017 [Oopsacas minuta]